MPLANPDFSPFLQRAHDLAPDTLFVFVPAGQAGTFARQFSERGLDKSGIKLIGPGDIVDDDDLPTTGDTLLGVVTAGIYSAAHPSQLNKDYVAAYKKATGHRANFISVGGYDGMNLIYQALKATNGNTDADTVVGAMKGMKWESPRGPISIDPRTRDIVQNIYIRKVQKVNGEPWAIEFDTFPAVKDPLKEARGASRHGKAMRGVTFLGDRKLQLAEFPDPGAGPARCRGRDQGLRHVRQRSHALSRHRRRFVAWARQSSGPVIAGHEPCGVVAAVGSAVDERTARIGSRVMVHHYSGCGSCRHCQTGWSQMCSSGSTVYGRTGHGAPCAVYESRRRIRWWLCRTN